MNSIERLRELGQSVWLDYLDHRILASGELGRLIRMGVAGVTSNPTIFDKAISGSSDYDDFIARAPSDDVAKIFESIEVREVTRACDLLRPLHDHTEGRDGFVSIEVSPGRAHDTAGTIDEAGRLWARVNRPNVMVKIPATTEGIPAIEQCLGDGININVTLLFSVARYRQVTDAFMRARACGRRHGAASVASFFVSRVDTKIDQALARVGASADLRGHAAIANAKLAYELYLREFGDSKDARPQRLLWASTSPKDPAYHDLYYADALVGRDTVDTMTPATLNALVDHGHAQSKLALGMDEAREQLTQIAAHGIDFDTAMQELEDEGVAKFEKSYNQACASIARRRPAHPAASV